MNTPNIETRFNYASAFDKDSIVVPIQVARDQIAALKEKHRSFETAAQGLRDALERSLQHHGCDPCHIIEALTRFDALKEAK